MACIRENQNLFSLQFLQIQHNVIVTLNNTK